MQNDRFEIRKGIPKHERHNAVLQAAYDTVDRMANVFGDLTFGELFAEPFSQWIPTITPNVYVAAAYGLLGDPDEVVGLLDRIAKAHGDESFRTMAELMSSDEVKLSREIYSPVYKLWIHHGIRLPELTRTPTINTNILKCIDDVIEHAGDLSYKTVLMTRRTKDLKTAYKAVGAAADAFIIYMPPGNGLCCSCYPANPSHPAGCQCVSGHSYDWCAQLTATTVAGGSVTCLGNSPS
jgi:hypothetical protein